MMRCECDCDCLATPNLHESVCDECQRGNHDWSRSGEPDGWTYVVPTDGTCEHEWECITANRCECTKCTAYAYQG